MRQEVKLTLDSDLPLMPSCLEKHPPKAAFFSFRKQPISLGYPFEN